MTGSEQGSTGKDRFIGGDPNGKPLMEGVPRDQWVGPVLDFYARMEGPVVYEQNGTRFNLPPIMAHHLPLANAWLDYNQFLSSDQIELPVAIREVAVLRIAWHMRCAYEWFQHRVIGRRLGMSEEQLDAVAEGESASLWSEEERLAIRTADELHNNGRVLPQTLEKLVEVFGQKKLLELMWAIGTYEMLAKIINTFEVPIEDFAVG